MTPYPYQKQNQSTWTIRVSLLLSIVSIIVASATLLFSRKSEDGNSHQSRSRSALLDRLDKEGILHAGYGVTPPYSLEDPVSGVVSGYTVDIIERIAQDLKVKVKWHRLNWNTFIPDLKRGEFDIIGEPIFMTIPRSRELAFSDPVDYFPDGIVTLRMSDDRFRSYEELNRPGTKIVVQMGFASEAIARSTLPKAEITALPPGTDQLQLFSEVAFSRADAAISEGGIAKLYLKEHPNTVKLLNIDNPKVWLPGAFALHPDDIEGARAISVCIRYLETTGEIAVLRAKWGLPANNKPSGP